MSEINFHSYDQEFRSLRKRIANSQMCEANKAVLERFCSRCIAEGLSTGRATKYLESMKKIDSYLGKGFTEANKEDVENVAVQIDGQSIP